MTTRFKLGKTPARHAIKLKLRDYATALPATPDVFGHEALLPANVGMLGNDQFGDCVWAGAAHETILWNLEAGATVTFTADDSLADYAAVTGFKPTDPSSDQGTDMQVAAAYRKATGVIDASGNRHTVAAYLAVEGLEEAASAAYLFGACGIGIQVPSSAQDQFSAGEPWDVVDGSSIDGGHYVPLVGRAANGNYLVITWGRVQEATPAFLERYQDEAIAYLSDEFLTGGKSLEGFDLPTLTADLAAL